MPLANEVNTALGRLLWPERVPISEQDRGVAVARSAHAQASGDLTGDQVDRRRRRLAVVRTRADLRMTMVGLPGVPPHAAVAWAARLVAALWLIGSAVQFVIWSSIIAIAGRWESPWWLLTTISGGVATAGLRWLTGAGHRRVISDISDHTSHDIAYNQIGSGSNE